MLGEFPCFTNFFQEIPQNNPKMAFLMVFGNVLFLLEANFLRKSHA